jgi:hypothetical protein
VPQASSARRDFCHRTGGLFFSEADILQSGDRPPDHAPRRWATRDREILEASGVRCNCVEVELLQGQVV